MFKPLQRWLTTLVCLGLMASGALGASCAVDELPGPDATVGESASYLLDGPQDPNTPDADHGAPKKPLPANPAGWGNNQNGKQFPHYGRIEVRLCDLPRDFTVWSPARQRKWCRAELVRQDIDMPAKFTNHELVETRGNQKYLAVYKVDMADHSSSGRPLMYHPPDPARGGKAYRGGIAQLRDVPGHHFQRKKPPRRRRPPPRPPRFKATSDPPALEAEAACEDGCDACAECAATPEEAGEFCGEYCPL